MARDRDAQTRGGATPAAVERKLDVLIEGQGLGGRLRERWAAEEAAREARRQEIAEQFRRSRPQRS